MLVEHSAEVGRPMEEIGSWCSSDSTWLEPLASAATSDGEACLRVGPPWAGGRMGREVKFTVGACRTRGEATAVSVRWEAATLPALFPVLEADIEVRPLDEKRCLVTLCGSYMPPLGGLGLALDGAVLHLLAESTVSSFVDRLAASLERGESVAQL